MHSRRVEGRGDPASHRHSQSSTPLSLQLKTDKTAPKKKRDDSCLSLSSSVLLSFFTLLFFFLKVHLRWCSSTQTRALSQRSHLKIVCECSTCYVSLWAVNLCLFSPLIRLNVRTFLQNHRWVQLDVLQLYDSLVGSGTENIVVWFKIPFFQSAQTELEVIRLPLKNKLLLLLQNRLETSAGLKKKTFLMRQRWMEMSPGVLTHLAALSAVITQISSFFFSIFVYSVL